MINVNFKSLSLFFSLFIPVIAMAAPPEASLGLTDAEQQWLESHTTVKFTGDPNWLPYEAFDSKGNYIGIVSSHLNLIAESTGLVFEMSPSKTWTESTEKAKQGMVDVLSETDDSDLKSHLNFTIPYISNPIVIAMHSRENYVESIANIQNRKIALIKDYGYTSKIRKKYSEINFLTVDDIQHGLISVSTGEIDALLCTLALCSYTISELGLNNVKITGKTEFDTKLALGVQKDLPILLSILNKAIEKITREQQQVILDSWIKNKLQKKTDYALVYKVAAISLALISVFVIWNRRLSREVDLRKKTESELKSAEEVLRLSHQRFLLHREHSPLAIIEWNTDFEFLDWNPAAQKIFGYTKEEVLGCHITEKILPESARQAVDKIWDELLTNKGGTYSLNENTTKDGRVILCEWHNTPLVDDDCNVIGVASLVEDITEQEKNEENLRQSQKMDALGKLTGGVAHDFNNMLGVILGFTELLKDRVDQHDPKQIKYCNEIFNAAERAKKLTSNLLAFSRKVPSSVEKTDINNMLNSMQHMLEKTLTHRIKLIFELKENIWPVLIDRTRMEDAVLNICINAMHAMPEGGSIVLNTSNVSLLDSDGCDVNVEPGDYVLLSIRDNGIGMTHDTQLKIFDPFFTTKGAEGTGLGMSQVYGFVQQSDASIQVSSELGKGTKITLYIPRFLDQQNDKIDESKLNLVKLPSGIETILVVDDEVALLDLNTEILSDHGYTVYRAESAKQAMDILANKHVDLLLSDVIMPDMNGYQLALEVEKLFPSIKIQMVSGYSDKFEENLTDSLLHQQRLQKPVSSEKLLQRVRLLLDTQYS